MPVQGLMSGGWVGPWRVSATPGNCPRALPDVSAERALYSRASLQGLARRPRTPWPLAARNASAASR